MKKLANIYYANVNNVNLMVGNIIQIKRGIAINLSVKVCGNIMYEKRVTFGVPVHVILKMINT